MQSIAVNCEAILDCASKYLFPPTKQFSNHFRNVRHVDWIPVQLRGFHFSSVTLTVPSFKNNAIDEQLYFYSFTVLLYFICINWLHWRDSVEPAEAY